MQTFYRVRVMFKAPTIGKHYRDVYLDDLKEVRAFKQLVKRAGFKVVEVQGYSSHTAKVAFCELSHTLATSVWDVRTETFKQMVDEIVKEREH